MLGPRKGRFEPGFQCQGSPTSLLIGMFMLWWGWLAFNCGSTFGISGGKWKLASKAAVTTLNASMGGGMIGIFMSLIVFRGKYSIKYIVNSVLGGLVGITAGCAIIRPGEAIAVGMIGALIVIGVDYLLEKLKIDDPVSAFAVHGGGGFWGMIATGLFAQSDPLENMSNDQVGLFHSGNWYFLGIQMLACLCIATWSALSTILLLGILKLTIGIRMSPEEEALGADYTEHDFCNPLHEKFGSKETYVQMSSNNFSGRRFSAIALQKIFTHQQTGPENNSSVEDSNGRNRISTITNNNGSINSHDNEAYQTESGNIPNGNTFLENMTEVTEKINDLGTIKESA